MALLSQPGVVVVGAPGAAGGGFTRVLSRGLPFTRETTGGAAPDTCDEWDPNEWDPSEWDPNEWDPSEWDPNEWDPNDWDPNDWDPTEWDPNEWDPTEWDLIHQVPLTQSDQGGELPCGSSALWLKSRCTH